MAPSLILKAIRKAQVAIYYSLGDPAFVEAIVHQTIHDKQRIQDPVLKCLVGIERTMQHIAQTPQSDYEKAITQVDDLIKTASEIVELFTGEKA